MSDGTHGAGAAGRADDADRVVPLRIDLSALVRRSVATLYSHLVTRPTGQALRLGIERQISELGALCVSVLDFTQVVVLDYSCADEMIAKLLQRYGGDDAEVRAYFVARAVDESHRQTIEAVLRRHDLALAAQLDDGSAALLGSVSEAEAAAWAALERLGAAPGEHIAEQVGDAGGEIDAALDRLARRRLVVRQRPTGAFVSLTSLIAED